MAMAKHETTQENPKASTADGENQEAKTPQPSKAAAPEIPVTKLADIRLKQFLNNDWRVKLPQDVSFEQAQDPAFMAVCLAVGSKNFRSFDTILAVSLDATWVVELLVVDAGVGWVDLQILRTFEFQDRRDQGEGRVPDGYSIFRDPHEGWWGARRDKDGHVMIERALNREEAVHELLNHAIFRNHQH